MKRRAFMGVAGASLATVAGCLSDSEYTVTDVSAEGASDPISLDVELLDANAEIQSPAELEFSLTNEGDRSIRVRNIGIWPLGILGLIHSPLGTPQRLRTDETGTPLPDTSTNQSQDEFERKWEIRLWNDGYEESEYVNTDGRTFGVLRTPVIQSIDAYQTITTTYELRGDDVFKTGTYYLRGFFDFVSGSDGTPPICYHAGPESDKWVPFLPDVTLTIEAQSGLISI